MLSFASICILGSCVYKRSEVTFTSLEGSDPIGAISPGRHHNVPKDNFLFLI